MRVLSDQAQLSVRSPHPPRWHPSVPARRAQLLRPPDRSAPRWVRVLVSVRAPREPLRRPGQVSGVSGYY
ncbi:hypothetical protein NDU88_008295 [Pleurodeles waltl]|uniref:Uncharacterized protein n=1 Tax=Pleurodeles waltl TaxID=8319 RepID=A0AAV7RSR3_PLEWA|nr:hypothetical protein NDU88_008295 [Pleurodeles waltl]